MIAPPLLRIYVSDPNVVYEPPYPAMPHGVTSKASTTVAAPARTEVSRGTEAHSRRRRWVDVKGVDHDGDTRRGRVLRSRHFDRQGMAHGSQARQGVDDRLGYVPLGIRVEGVGNDASIQDYAGDPGLGPAEADPADRGPGEGECGLIPPDRRYRSGPLAVRMVPVVPNPTGGIVMAGSVSWWRVPEVFTSNASTVTMAAVEGGL